MRGALAALLALLLAAPAATAAEITVLCARAVQHAVATAAEGFQRSTRHGVWLSYGDSAIVVGRALLEEADVVVTTVAGIGDLEAKAAVRPGSRVGIGRIRMGIAVRAGAPRPDVATTAALRRTILQAASIGYADPASGAATGRLVLQVLDRLGVTELIRFKTTRFPDGPRALAALARGEVALVVAPAPEIRRAEGVALAGALPAELQQVADYAAAVMTRSAAPEVAAAFLAYLASPEGRAHLEAAGVERGD